MRGKRLIEPNHESATRATSHDETPMVVEAAERLGAAKYGDSAALGELLDRYREYLTLLANDKLSPGLATKVGASDLVQETFLAAQRGIGGFRGSTPSEWRAWLEAILVNQLANLRRTYLDTQKRRGEPVPQGGNVWFNERLRDSITPPSRQLQRRGLEGQATPGASPWTDGETDPHLLTKRPFGAFGNSSSDAGHGRLFSQEERFEGAVAPYLFCRLTAKMAGRSAEDGS